MSTYIIVTAQESERFWELNNGMVRADGPAFLEHDSTVAQHWSRLDETFPDNQFCLGRLIGCHKVLPRKTG